MLPPAAPRAHRRGRPDPPELTELHRVRAAHPELADAVDLEIALFGLHRRTQQRLPVPWLEVNEDWLHRQMAEGRPLVRFEDLPLTATELRLLVREVADLLHRAGLLDREALESTLRLVHEEYDLLALAARWYNAVAAPEADGPASDGVAIDENVLHLAMRPFLARCAESLAPLLNGTSGTTRRCPLCGGEPELGMRNGGDRWVLACGRCTCRWRFDGPACVHCGCDDRAALRTFAIRGSGYGLLACDRCRHYLKFVDPRVLGRPLMLPADAVATLPLDAAAQQRGYTT